MSFHCDLGLEDSNNNQKNQQNTHIHTHTHTHHTHTGLTLRLMMLHHHTKFGNKNVLWFRKYHPEKHSPTLWAFIVTLTLDTVIPFFHRTFRLMMLYYQTKFSCERTSSLENTIKIVSPCCDLDRERSNHFSPQDTQAYYAVLSNKVWLQTDQQFRRYSENSHILII